MYRVGEFLHEAICMADQHRSVARLTADVVDVHPKIGEIHQLIQHADILYNMYS